MATPLRDHVIAYVELHHKLIEAGAVDLLLRDRQPLVLCQAVLDVMGADAPIMTPEIVDEVLARRSSPRPRLGAVASTTEPSAGGSAPSPREAFALIREGFSPPPAHQDPLRAYEGLFADRYRRLARMLRGRPGLGAIDPIGKLDRGSRKASIIGIVSDVRTTSKQHHLIVRVEDESGSTPVLIPRDSPLAHQPILADEVIGLALSLPKTDGQLPRAEAMERPDVPLTRPLGRADQRHRALFLSDLHIGSKSFLQEEWGRLIGFLKGETADAEAAAGIDCAVIAGDLVDGIGIYPHQERDLAIGDVVEQYAELGRRLRELPPSMPIVVVPGNHDAVSPAEPQPALAAGLAKNLPENVRSLSNPSTFALHGVTIEAYHGRSFDDLIPALPGTSYSRPTEVMKRMLAMRHLAPIYGSRTPLAPLPRDGLVIDPAPDIFVTGHAHTFAVDRYRDVLLLNVSTWQGETEYQKMRNISAVPARAAIVDLRQPNRLGSVLTVDASGREVRVTTGGPA